MSYNLLLDTEFKKINNRWKTINCEYKDGYLIGKSKFYSIEQTITLRDPTCLYFSMDYICFDNNVVNVWVGIQSNYTLEANKKVVKLHKRVRSSIISDIKVETIKVILIVEAKQDFQTKIYIDSPLLVDLNYSNKNHWPKYFLDKFLHYKKGYCYNNSYFENEITESNLDFQSLNQVQDIGKIGIITSMKPQVHSDWFHISHDFIQDSYYLVKLDYEEVNNYGQIYFKYGEYLSENWDNNQLYILFKATNGNKLKLIMENPYDTSYAINLKHLLIVKIDNMNIDLEDIPHIPFVEN